MEFHQVT